MRFGLLEIREWFVVPESEPASDSSELFSMLWDDKAPVEESMRIVLLISTPYLNFWAGCGHGQVTPWPWRPAVLFVSDLLKLFFKKAVTGRPSPRPHPCRTIHWWLDEEFASPHCLPPTPGLAWTRRHWQKGVLQGRNFSVTLRRWQRNALLYGEFASLRLSLQTWNPSLLPDSLHFSLEYPSLRSKPLPVTLHPQHSTSKSLHSNSGCPHQPQPSLLTPPSTLNLWPASWKLKPKPSAYLHWPLKIQHLSLLNLHTFRLEL